MKFSFIQKKAVYFLASSLYAKLSKDNCLQSVFKCIPQYQTIPMHLILSSITIEMIMGVMYHHAG